MVTATAWNARGLFTENIAKCRSGIESSPKPKRAQSDSGNLHLIPYVLLFTPGYFFSIYLFTAVLWEMRPSIPLKSLMYHKKGVVAKEERKMNN